MQKSIGKVPDDAVLPPCPEYFEYLISWFRQVGGPEPLTYTEIYHWSKLTGSQPRPWEVDLLMHLDAVHQQIRQEHV